MLREHHFRAMNTDVGIWLWSALPAAESALRKVEHLFMEVESQLSRFRVDSELSRLNASAGQGAVAVSPLLQNILGQALAAALCTEGIFDPTILPLLRQAGYDRSFELLTETSDENRCQPVRSTRTGWQQVCLDQTNGTVQLPAGVAIDLGGIGKGWTVDRASELLVGWGPSLVDAGGDIRACGMPSGSAWPVGIEDSFQPGREFMTLGLENHAVATSTIGKRTWQRNRQSLHHLIDPRTGTPSDSDLHTVTALAFSTTEAEVAAKTALLMGSQDGATWLHRQGHAAILTQRSGERVCVGQLPLWKRGKQ